MNIPLAVAGWKLRVDHTQLVKGFFQPRIQMKMTYGFGVMQVCSPGLILEGIQSFGFHSDQVSFIPGQQGGKIQTGFAAATQFEVVDCPGQAHHGTDENCTAGIQTRV
jgi:hypothetical protein